MIRYAMCNKTDKCITSYYIYYYHLYSMTLYAKSYERMTIFYIDVDKCSIIHLNIAVHAFHAPKGSLPEFSAAQSFPCSLAANLISACS